MFADGYVGTAEDSVRIRRQQKEREKERKKFEELAKAKHDEAAQAGLKQFAATTTEVMPRTTCIHLFSHAFQAAWAVKAESCVTVPVSAGILCA